jgi:carbonic anhydrase
LSTATSLNLAPPQDANYLSVLQFAVDVLNVKRVLIIGHYGCGGVAAAVDGKRRGLVDHWLHPIREPDRHNLAASIWCTGGSLTWQRSTRRRVDPVG